MNPNRLGETARAPCGQNIAALSHDAYVISFSGARPLCWTGGSCGAPMGADCGADSVSVLLRDGAHTLPRPKRFPSNTNSFDRFTECRSGTMSRHNVPSEQTIRARFPTSFSATRPSCKARSRGSAFATPIGRRQFFAPLRQPAANTSGSFRGDDVRRESAFRNPIAP